MCRRFCCTLQAVYASARSLAVCLTPCYCAGNSGTDLLISVIFFRLVLKEKSVCLRVWFIWTSEVASCSVLECFGAF